MYRASKLVALEVRVRCHARLASCFAKSLMTLRVVLYQTNGVGGWGTQNQLLH